VIAYVDASVLLRLVLGQPNALTEWPSIRHGVASALVRTESIRTIDRTRLRGNLSDAELASRRSALMTFVGALEVVNVDSIVLERASAPMPTALRTLDAIHLVTALLWREATGRDLVMATHDDDLALGARAHGLQVVGVSTS
jgi:uncharacterized protein